MSRLVNWKFFNPIFFMPNDRCGKRLYIYFDICISSYCQETPRKYRCKKVVGIKFFAVELPISCYNSTILIQLHLNLPQRTRQLCNDCCLFVLPFFGQTLTFVHFGDKNDQKGRLMIMGGSHLHMSALNSSKPSHKSHECNQHIMRHQSKQNCIF